jgi:hypothetical protein
MKLFPYILFILLLTICSCKNENIESLQNALIEKDQEIRQLKNEIESLKNDLKSSNFGNQSIRDYSNEEIISIVKNEMGFTCPKTQIKDFVVRKTSSENYEVRFYQKIKEFDNYYWDKIIVHIQVFPDDKYTYDIYDGTQCQE